MSDDTAAIQEILKKLGEMSDRLLLLELKFDRFVGYYYKRKDEPKNT